MTIQVTLWTQATFAAFDEHLQMITLAGDPKFALLFLFPVLLWMSGAGVAAPVIGAIVASDLLNALVKWPLQGPRPFWVDDAVREFWMTCESGYGMPRFAACPSLLCFAMRSCSPPACVCLQRSLHGFGRVGLPFGEPRVVTPHQSVGA